MAELIQNPARYLQQRLRTRGRIDAVCNEAGCWIDIRPLGGGKGALFVNPLHKAFSFPVDCAGMIAEAEGRFFAQEVAAERLEHWSHHGWRRGTTIQGSQEVLRLEVTAADLTREARSQLPQLLEDCP